MKPSKDDVSLTSQEAEPSMCVGAAFQAEKSLQLSAFSGLADLSRGGTKYVEAFFAEFCANTLGFSKTCILGLKLL